MEQLETINKETVQSLKDKYPGISELRFGISDSPAFIALDKFGSLGERMNPVPLCREAYAKTL